VHALMGVNSYDRSHPLEKYMREALCFPIYDAGNIGMQRRKIHGVMATFIRPRAFVETSDGGSRRDMEGLARPELV